VFRLLAAALALLTLPLVASANWQFNGVPVSTAPHYQADPVIVTDGAGGAIIAWIDYRNGDYDIYAQRLNSAGIAQWTADGVPVCVQPGNQITASMVSDEVGGAVIVWHDARNNINNGLEVYAQRLNGSGTALWTANGEIVSAASANQSDPVVVKSANNFVIAWADFRNLGISDIYAQAMNASGAPQWTADGVALTAIAGHQWNPQIAPDNVGGAVVTWEDLRGGGNDIYARRIDQLGNVQWSANGVIVCNAANDQYRPQIVGDGAAGGIIAWFDWRGGAPDIYMQRIDSSGSALWTANGTAICTAPFAQDSPSLVQDAGGGATVVWADKRNGANADIYAQHVNNAGVPYFAADGVAVCTAAGEQFSPRITRDPASAGIVVWFDRRAGSNNSDVYAQKLDYLDGSSQWTANGVVLCTEPHNQEGCKAVSDGSGGAIVAWADLREGNYWDVYAERVNATPTAVEHTPAVTALRVLPNHPNPFTGTTTVEFVLPQAGDVEIGVYDVSGRRVATQHLTHATAGSHSVMMSSNAIDGTPLPSGVYFCRVRAGAETVTKKMVIAR